MKRSKRVNLLLMGSAALALAGCGEEEAEQAGVYESVEECVSGGMYTETFCRESFEQANKLHPQMAPRYASAKDCEADFGANHCQGAPPPTGVAASADSGGSFWMPLMAGFMVSQALGAIGRAGQPLYRPNEERRDYNGYAGRGYSPGSWRTAGNVEVARRTGGTLLNRGTFAGTPVRSTTISRGGFGSRAASVGVSS